MAATRSAAKGRVHIHVALADQAPIHHIVRSICFTEAVEGASGMVDVSHGTGEGKGGKKD